MMRTAVAMGASLAAFPQEPQVEPICGRDVRGGNGSRPSRAGAARLLRGRPAFQCPSMCGKVVILSQNGAGRTMHDIVIRGGSIVDGTGAPARPGDVAI